MDRIYQNNWRRWFTLITVLLNIFFGYLPGSTLSLFHENTTTRLVPPAYPDALFVLLSLILLFYGIHQLLPLQRNKLLYDRIAGPLILLNVLTICWRLADHYYSGSISALPAIAMLPLAAGAFRSVKAARQQYHYGSSLPLLFSAYLGWATLSCTVSADSWIGASMANEGASASSTPEIIILSMVVILSCVISHFLRDAFYPLVIGGALVFTWLFGNQNSTAIAIASLTAGIILLATSLHQAIRIYHEHRQVPCYNGRSVMKIVR